RVSTLARHEKQLSLALSRPALPAVRADDGCEYTVPVMALAFITESEPLKRAANQCRAAGSESFLTQRDLPVANDRVSPFECREPVGRHVVLEEGHDVRRTPEQRDHGVCARDERI